MESIMYVFQLLLFMVKPVVMTSNTKAFDEISVPRKRRSISNADPLSRIPGPP